MWICHTDSHAKFAGMNRRWRFRLPPGFFGLNDKYIANVYEEFFLLKYHGGWSFAEAYSLPVVLRRWFLERLSTQMSRENEARQNANKGKSYDVGTGPPAGPSMMPKK